MKGFVEGMDRQQAMLLPECLDDWVGENTLHHGAGELGRLITLHPGARRGLDGRLRRARTASAAHEDRLAYLGDKSPMRCERVRRRHCSVLLVMIWLISPDPVAAVASSWPTWPHATPCSSSI